MQSHRAREARRTKKASVSVKARRALLPRLSRPNDGWCLRLSGAPKGSQISKAHGLSRSNFPKHYSITMHPSRPRPDRVKQQSKRGNLFAELPAISEQQETSAIPMSIVLSPVEYQCEPTIPSAPKVYKSVISYTRKNRIRRETPDVPFPISLQSSPVRSPRRPTPPLLPTLSPAVLSKARTFSSVVELGELDPNDYKLSRAQAA